MNREIKFRIWDKKNNIFIYEWDASHKRLAISLNGLVYSGMYDDVLPENDYTIQQYTGLKDSKEVEIYEGDLVRYEKEYTSVDKYSIIAPVVFSPFGYGFVLDSSRRHGIGDSKYGDYVPLLSPIVMEKKVTYEVVGNIFKNTNE
jgi:uncharacterized phage protein (TIGR01671 family)